MWLQALGDQLIPYAAPLLALVLVRAFAIRRAVAGMHDKARTPFAQPPGAAGPETPPQSAPKFETIDITSRVLVDAGTDRAARSGLHASLSALGWLVLALLAYAGVLVLAATRASGAAGAGQLATPDAVTAALVPDAIATSLLSLAGAWVVALVAGVLLFVVLARFSSLGYLDPLWLLALWIALTALAVIAASSGVAAPVLALLAPLAFGAIVGQWFWRLRRRQRALGSLTLLVLRVFGADRNTLFVFGPLAAVWKHLGAHFTIVDPSYLRFTTSIRAGKAHIVWLRILGAISLVGVLVAFAARWLPLFSTGTMAVRFAALDSDLRTQIVWTALWLLLIPVAVVFAVRAVRSRFVDSPEALTGRIASASTPRPWFRTNYPAVPLFCHDDVWRPAVHEMFGVAKAVVMDLRGYTPERHGCEYEIGALMDRVPVSHILFLVDRGPAGAQVQQLILDRWNAMRADSPNRTLSEPVVRLYATTPFDPRDVPQIVRLLALATRSGADPGAQLVALEPRKPRWLILRALSRANMVVSGIAEWVSGWLDMAVVRPRVSWAAAVVLAAVAIVPLVAQVRRGPEGDGSRGGANSAAAAGIVTDGARDTAVLKDTGSMTTAQALRTLATIRVDPTPATNALAAGWQLSTGAPGEAPIATDIVASLAPGGTCKPGRAFGADEGEIAAVGLVFTGERVRALGDYAGPIFRRAVDGNGRTLDPSSAMEDGAAEWHTRVDQALSPGDPGRAAPDPRRWCFDFTFKVPKGGTLVADISGQLPVELAGKPSATVMVERLQSLPSSPTAVNEVHAADKSTEAFVKRTGARSISVIVKGPGIENWAVNAVDVPSGAKTMDVDEGLIEINDSKQINLDFNHDLDNYRIKLTRRGEIRIPFDFKGVTLVKTR